MKKLPTTFTNKKYRYTYMFFPPLTSFRPRLLLFRERLSEKMCTRRSPRQSRKVIWDMFYTLFLTLYLSNLLLLLSFSTHRHTIHGLSCHSIKFLWKTVNSKPPTIPFGVVACTLSDNLSRKLVSGRRIALPAESTWAKLTPLPYNQANNASAGSADRVDPAIPAQVFIREKSWPG